MRHGFVVGAGVSIGLARVTISAPQRRVDVALPEHVPLAELLPEVLRHAGEGLADDGEKHGGWLLRRTDGVALATAQGLFPQGVRDGEVLHLVPARDDWPELEYDDVVEAIAEGARRRGTRRGRRPRPARRPCSAAGVLLALGLHRGAAGRSGVGRRGLRRASASALLLALAGVTASRAYGDARGRCGARRVRDALRVRRRRGAGRHRRPGRRASPAALARRPRAARRRRWRCCWSRRSAGSAWPASLRLFTGRRDGRPARRADRADQHGHLGGRRRGGADLGAGLRHRRAAAAGDPVRQDAHPAGHPADRRDARRASPAPSRGERAGRGPGAPGPGHRLRRGRPAPRSCSPACCSGTRCWPPARSLVLATAGSLSARILIAVSAAALLLRSRLFVTLRQRVPLVVRRAVRRRSRSASTCCAAPAPAMLLGGRPRPRCCWRCVTVVGRRDLLAQAAVALPGPGRRPAGHPGRGVGDPGGLRGRRPLRRGRQHQP